MKLYNLNEHGKFETECRYGWIHRDDLAGELHLLRSIYEKDKDKILIDKNLKTYEFDKAYEELDPKERMRFSELVGKLEIIDYMLETLKKLS